MICLERQWAESRLTGTDAPGIASPRGGKNEWRENCELLVRFGSAGFIGIVRSG